MYLRSLEVHNLKLIRDLQLDFLHEGQPRMWTVLVGENGLCKTSLLQAIALVASAATRGNQLCNVLSLADQRRPEEEVFINGEFDFAGATEFPGADTSGDPPRLRSRVSKRAGKNTATLQSTSCYLNRDGLYIAPNQEMDESPGPLSAEDARRMLNQPQHRINHNPLEEARSTNTPGWLVVAYGTTRQLVEPKSSSIPNDPALNRMAPLFKDVPLVGTDFIDYLNTSDELLALRYSEELNRALMSVEELLPRINAFERRGQGGVKTSEMLTQSHRFSFGTGDAAVKIPATWLSQGYQATIAWIADLLGQGFWDRKAPISAAEMQGLVLIDELDLHLHPRWQKGLINSLKTVFPKMQFIVTTHSPMLLSQLQDHEIIRLTYDDEGNVIQAPPLPNPEPPVVMTASKLLQIYYGIDNLFPQDLGKALSRYGFLTGDPGRSEEEECEMKALEALLKEAGIDPGWEAVPRAASSATGPTL